MKNTLLNISEQFDFKGNIKDIRPISGGWINDTFFIETESSSPNYILQRKNKNIFTDIPSMMDNIQKVTSHLKKKIIETGGDPLRESLTIIPTKENQLYYKDENGDFWAACLFIENTVAYEKADSIKLATQGGMGIGKFQVMLADMKEPLTNILPGFHNIKFRFEQWEEILTKDPIGRKSEVQNEINWIENRKSEMLEFWNKIETGIIPTRVTHNDTKISNILFDKNDNILCVIDLDTVLNSTCLNDFGDAIRTYANAGKEDDTILENVYIKLDFFEAYTKGYLSETIKFLNQEELNNLAFSAKYIIFEQVLRFLMDYINGDKYYKVTSQDHNLIRTRAQYKLLQSLEDNFDEMCNIVKKLTKEFIK